MIGVDYVMIRHIFDTIIDTQIYKQSYDTNKHTAEINPINQIPVAQAHRANAGGNHQRQ